MRVPRLLGFLSNALNASLARSTATVTVLDNENVISNATALDDINSKPLTLLGHNSRPIQMFGEYDRSMVPRSRTRVGLKATFVLEYEGLVAFIATKKRAPQSR